MSVLILSLTTLAFGDVASVRTEPNAEKRSSVALDEADAEIGLARTAYREGNLASFREHVQNASELTTLSYQSLQESGKHARKSPKWFKRAEQRLLLLLRRVDSLAKDVSGEDRASVDALEVRMRDVHDQLLQDIMSKK